MSNTFPPGVQGPVGKPPPQKRAPAAWNHMLLGFLRDLPAGLNRSKRARRQMLPRRR